MVVLLAISPTFAQDDEEMDVVSIAYLPYLSFAAIDIGIEAGYFAEQNIQVEKVIFTRSLDTILPLLTGDLDVVLGGTNTQLINVLLESDDVMIVGGGSQINPEAGCSPYQIMMSKERAGDFESIADFAGLKAISLSTQHDYW